ncbi:MAG: 4Fe-4S dicluster domain-containing protein [Phycisphaerae bacterium]
MLHGNLSWRWRHVPGGLYFGPPVWDAPVWPAQDSNAPRPPVQLPATPTELRDLTVNLKFARHDIWTPSLPEQLVAKPVQRIILNLIPPQPESIMPRVLSEFQLPRLVAGLNLIRQCLSNPRTGVAAPRDEPELRYQWRDPARRHQLRMYPLTNRYPLGHPSILLRNLLGLKLRSGELPTQLGVLLLDPITCWMLGYWMATGSRPEWRPIEIFTHDAMPIVVGAPLGHALAAILTAAGVVYQDRQCIVNGMMAGELLDPTVTVMEPWMQTISIRPVPRVEKPVDCIRCGWCVSACPAGLNPVGLMAQVHVIEGLPIVSSYEAAACIECGLCSYVCPSRLPLAVSVCGIKTGASLIQFPGGAA